MPLPCIRQSIVQQRGTFKFNHIRIFVTFVHRINMQEEYCLFLARTLTSKYLSRIDDRMQIERTSNIVDFLDEVARNDSIVLQ